MALKLNERYPGRFSNPSAEYPQGSFKNRTSPEAKDGSYLEKDWANDKEGFFQSLLSAKSVEPNGLVDSVGESQYYDALIETISDSVEIPQATPTVMGGGKTAVASDAYIGTSTTLLMTPAAFKGAQATETSRGVAAIATQAETAAGAIDTHIVTPLKLQQSRPQKAQCTSWVNFNGTGTVSMRDSYNVSSIVDLGVGSYTVNFATPMSNLNFSLGGICSNGAVGVGNANVQERNTGNRTLSSFEISTIISNSAGDFPYVSVQSFGGK